MDPIVKRVIGSIVRTALAGIIPFLISAGLEADEAEQILAILVTAVPTVIWSIWQKFRDRDGIEK